jgi:hypothetical protein
LHRKPERPDRFFLNLRDNFFVLEPHLGHPFSIDKAVQSRGQFVARRVIL